MHTNSLHQYFISHEWFLDMMDHFFIFYIIVEDNSYEENHESNDA